jgi:hypothetical protein
MARFYIDDEKLASIPDADRLEAAGLWIMAASWAWEQRNGGYVPMHLVTKWGGATNLPDVLVRAGLWAPIEGDEDGYLFVGTWVRG